VAVSDLTLLVFSEGSTRAVAVYRRTAISWEIDHVHLESHTKDALGAPRWESQGVLTAGETDGREWWLWLALRHLALEALARHLQAQAAH
jgi:hypothetical protein